MTSLEDQVLGVVHEHAVRRAQGYGTEVAISTTAVATELRENYQHVARTVRTLVEQGRFQLQRPVVSQVPETDLWIRVPAP